MPESSTPEGRNLCKEAQVLLEEAAVQQAESSASPLRSVASARADEATRQDHEASVHTPPANRAKAPSVHDRVRPTPVKDRLQDMRGDAHDGDARNVMNQKRRTVPLTATTLDMVDATTARRTGVHHWSLWAPTCSAGKSAPLLSPPALSATHHTHQVLGGDGSRALAQRLPPGMPAGWCD